MATIIEGVIESATGFLSTNLPDSLSAETDFNVLLGKAQELEAQLTKEQKDLEGFWDNAQEVSNLYQFIAADAKSLSVKKSAIRQVLAVKNSYCTTQLGKLEEEGVKGLAQALIDCTRDAGILEVNFKDIAGILLSLGGDIKTANLEGTTEDYAYAQLCRQLADIDTAKEEAAGVKIKKADTFMGKLTSFNSEKTGAKLEKVKGSFGDLYSSLVQISLKYQEITPQFDKLTALQTKLDAGITALETDLTTKTEEAISRAAEELAALEAKKEELCRLSLVTPSLADIAALDETVPEVDNEESTAAELGNGTTEEAKNDSTTGNPLGEITTKIKEALKAVKSNKYKRETFNKNVEHLKAVLAVKKGFNDKISEHVDALKGTQKVGVELNKVVAELGKCIEDLVTSISDLHGKTIKKGGETINSDFMTQLKTLGIIQEEIVTLNEGISQVESTGDVKAYFSEIVSILDAFPGPGKSVISNSLLIEHTLHDLKLWSVELQGNLGQGLKKALTNSTLGFDVEEEVEPKEVESSKVTGKKGGAEKKETPSKSRIDKLIDDLIGKKMNDADLSFPGEPIPIGVWQELDRAPRAAKGETLGLSDWQGFFQEELERLDAEDTDLDKKIEFLKQFQPEPAAS